MSNARPIVIYVDVDDTFVRSYGAKRIPMPAAIAHIRSLADQGAELYCWSSGGADYARSSAFECGIGDCFLDFLPKPNVVIDDQPLSEWRRLMHLFPTADRAETRAELEARLSGDHQSE